MRFLVVVDGSFGNGRRGSRFAFGSCSSRDYFGLRDRGRSRRLLGRDGRILLGCVCGNESVRTWPVEDDMSGETLTGLLSGSCMLVTFGTGRRGGLSEEKEGSERGQPSATREMGSRR